MTASRSTALAALLLWACTAQAEVSPHFNPATMMLSSEVQRGMKGIGKSVFHGVDITEFNVEILSVVERWNDGKDFIVGRVLDGPVVERKSGVMGGMSGSPVYINGKLIGAISSTFLYEREPVCGITPIEAMLECLDQPAKQAELSPYSLQRERYLARRGDFTLGGRRVSEVRLVPHAEAEAGFADEHTALMARVAPPVYCAGLPEPAMALLRKKLEPYGIEAVPGPGHMRNPVDTELVPGAAFGVPLMWGDFDVSTGGTITYRDGSLLLGFGHPFTLSGQVDIPITTAWVHDFVPRYVRTDKMQSCMKEVGALRQDRPWAVGGALGLTAGRVPMNLTVTDETRQLTRTFHVEALRQREMTPNMLMSAALSAIGVTYHDPGTGILKVRTRVKGSAGNEISREETYYHTGQYEQAAIDDLSQACGLLTQNRWMAQDVTECDYQVSLTNADRGATVEALSCDQNVAKAGEDLTLRVRIRPENSGPVEKKLTLHIPVSVEKGMVRLAVCGGVEAMRLRGRVGILPPVFTSLDAVIRFYEGLERNDQILALAGVQTKDLDIEGTRLMWMPSTMKDILENPMRTGVTRGGAELVHVEDIPWVLYGGAIMSLPIEDRLGVRGKPSSSSSKDSSGSDGSSSEETSLPALPKGVPASLWWAASAFCAPPVVGGTEPVNGNSKGTEKPAAEAKPAEEGTATEEETPSEEEEEAPANPKEGAVGRGPSFFLHSTASDFGPGKAEGVAVRSDGALQLCPPWQEIALPDELYVTALVAGKGVAYAGTCDPGKVYKIVDGKATVAFETGEFGVSALCLSADGTLLVGTMPRGRVFRVTPDGKGGQLCKLECGYAWDICEAAPGEWDVAGGNDACVWRVKADGTVRKLVDLRQGHAMRLLRVKDVLYIGTAQRGAIYRLKTDGRVESLYEAGTNDITALVAGPKDTIWLSTAPQGKVISLDSNGVAREQYSGGSNGVLSLAQVQAKMYAGEGTDGRVREIVKEGVNALVREDVGRQVVCLSAHGSVLYAGCSSPGRVLVGDLSAAATGKFSSAALDAKRAARWGRVDWQGTSPTGSSLTLRLRSGSTTDPKDGSWSPWSPAVAEPGRERVDLPSGQYLQYELELSRKAGAAGPVLDWLKISYMPANQSPTVRDFKPTESVALSGKVKLEWKMEDPDKDKLLATIQIRPRGGRDFRALKSNLTESPYEWDTKSVDDGAYDVRVVVDDSLSNPGDARTATLDVANLVVDNTAPEVEVISGPVKQADGGWAITAFAMDRGTRIANAAWQVKDEKIWHAARLDDGIYDWRYERFVVATGPLKASVTEIVIRVRDAAGNVTDKTVTLPKPETPAKTP
jgi:hypothetical protein